MTLSNLLSHYQLLSELENRPLSDTVGNLLCDTSAEMRKEIAATPAADLNDIFRKIEFMARESAEALDRDFVEIACLTLARDVRRIA